MRSVNMNSVYFLNADPANPSVMHQFDFGKQSWRSITTGGTVPNWNNVKAVMDYDTLVVYAFTDGRVSVDFQYFLPSMDTK